MHFRVDNKKRENGTGLALDGMHKGSERKRETLKYMETICRSRRAVYDTLADVIQ